MPLENGSILLKDVIHFHSGPSADTSQEDDKIGIFEGLFLAVGVVGFNVCNVGIAAVLKLKFKDVELIFFVGDFKQSQLNIDIVAEDVAFAKVVIQGVGDITASASNADDHRIFSHSFLYMFRIYQLNLQNQTKETYFDHSITIQIYILQN